MTAPSFPNDLIHRCNLALGSAWEDADEDALVMAVLRESGHAELVAALKEAIAELNAYSEAESGETFNNPDWNTALKQAGETL